MTAALVAALFFTVALLVINGYFLLGSVPLLTLKHDTPLDAGFVRGFFRTYYSALALAAGVTAVSYALAGRPSFAAGAAGLVLWAVFLRRWVISRMDSLRSRIEASDPTAVAAFRRIHAAAIVANLIQLALIVWSLIAFSMQLKR